MKSVKKINRAKILHIKGRRYRERTTFGMSNIKNDII